jgi:NAD-dependent SIR2 family protein deacetylase
MKKIVVLSGAGISAESGIAPFRDANGLWEGHDVYSVATPEGWGSNSLKSSGPSSFYIQGKVINYKVIKVQI